MLLHLMGPLIPITAIFMGIACAIVAMYFRWRRQREEQETIRTAMEKGIELPENLFHAADSGACGNGGSRGHSLRRGIFWTMVGLSLTLALWVNDGLEDAVWGGIPLAIGIGHLLLYAIAPKPPQAGKGDPTVHA